MFNLIPWGTSEQGTALGQRADSPFSLMRNEFDSLFDRFFQRWANPFAMEEWRGGWGFDMDETDKEFIVRADAPGFEAKDFDIQVSGNMLTIKAEQTQKAGKGKEKNGSFAQRRLFRSISLPAGADTQKVEAQYKNGILELHVPKSPEVQGRRIEVKA